MLKFFFFKKTNLGLVLIYSRFSKMSIFFKTTNSKKIYQVIQFSICKYEFMIQKRLEIYVTHINDDLCKNMYKSRVMYILSIYDLLT